MRLTKWLLMVLAASMLFIACNRTEPSKHDEAREGTTHVSVSLAFQSAFRATEDQEHNGIGDWGGRDEIKTIDVFILSRGTNVIQHFQEKTVKTAADFSKDGVYSLKPWKTTPGNKVVYVVVNGETEVINGLKQATVENFTTKYAEALTLVGSQGVDGKYAKTEGNKDVIMMTGASALVNVVDGVTEAQALAGSNTARVSVRRIAALVSVTMNKELHDQLTNGVEVKADASSSSGAAVTIGRLKNLKWTVAQYEKKSKLFEAGTTFADIKSPSFDYVTADGNQYNEGTDQAKNNYDYSLLKSGFDLASFSRSSDNKANVQSIVGGTMKFITETTHKYGSTEAETNYRRGNTAYIMVTGTFIPEQSAMATGEGSYTEGHDLYWGTIDGKFYTSEENAKKKNPVVAGTSRDGVIKFKGGKMYYFAWLNPDKIEPTKWLNSPVLRNNLYHVNVSRFGKLGFSGNPYNPGKDPEDDPDPDDPTPDPKDPINEKETYMTTEITVINWGAHSYDVKF